MSLVSPEMLSPVPFSHQGSGELGVQVARVFGNQLSFHDDHEGWDYGYRLDRETKSGVVVYRREITARIGNGYLQFGDGHDDTRLLLETKFSPIEPEGPVTIDYLLIERYRRLPEGYETVQKLMITPGQEPEFFDTEPGDLQEISPYMLLGQRVGRYALM